MLWQSALSIETYLEVWAHIFGAGDAHRASHLLNDLFNDGQTKSRARSVPVFVLLEAPKVDEQVVNPLLGHSHTSISHLQLELYVFFFPVYLNFFLLDLGNLRCVIVRLLLYCLLFVDRNWDGDSALRIRKLKRIREEIVQNLTKTVLIPVNLSDQRQVLHSVNFSVQLNFLLCGFKRHHLKGGNHKLAHVKVALRNVERTILQLC